MPAPEPELNDALATTLLANLGAFQGFARRRLGDDQLAADAVQESLLRALKSERSLSHDENPHPAQRAHRSASPECGAR